MTLFRIGRRLAGLSARRARGFTLLELMVVVAIVGVLSGMALNIYTHQRNKVNVELANSKILECLNRMSEKFMTDGKLPDTWDSSLLVTECSNWGLTDNISSGISTISFYNMTSMTYFSVMMRRDKSAIGGKLLSYVFDPNRLTWVCIPGGSGYEYAYGPGGHTGMMPEQYRPRSCRPN